MKQLTTLQIVMFMSLTLNFQHALGSSTNDPIEQEAVTDQVDAAQMHEATLQVLEILEVTNPDVVEHIILNEKNLENTFGSIKTFVNKKIKEIENLLEKNNITIIDIARLSVELADAQAAYEKTAARYKIQHKKSHKAEQAIQDALMQAAQGVKNLSLKSKSGLDNAYKYVKDTVRKVKK